MAGAIENVDDVLVTKFHRSYNIGPVTFNDTSINILLNSGTLTLICLLYSRRPFYLFNWVKKYSMLTMCHKNKRKCSLLQMIGNCFTIWTTLLNLLLIVICNPSILNPGPLTNVGDITVMYHNCRGLVPFRDLGKTIMSLDTDKVLDIQDSVYNEKPDVVVLNETWLTKQHLNNEIFPNDIYTVYRLDRCKRTHPPDPCNPDKFRIKGGGVLIAVKSSLEISVNKINIGSKAEILSIVIGTKTDSFCITTCYRVGTLGETNFKEIEKHLRNIAASKKFKAHIIIGDFNLSNTSWPAGNSSVELERQFIELFNDLGLVQLIEKPTHDSGRTLDLLLTNAVGFISNITVLDKDNICPSDHRGILFSLKMKVKAKISKRKMFNYKRANWDRLNNDLKSVRWDQHLKYCDAETGWHKFKDILGQKIEQHVPTITIKNKNQPSWFDSDTHHLCLKKERLRSKFKQSGLAADYKKYSQCRKEFKELVREKMTSNFDDEDDPALISKKFWSHLKSTSKSSRIPGTVNYNGRFRNNPTDQAEMFNEYFQHQFSEASNYNIDIDFSNDSDNTIGFGTSRIRKILKNINVHKAVGPDGIHGKILKNCRESLAYPLSILFKTSYNIGQIPLQWKLANVVPIHKKGSKALVENYRPISLTSLVMKVFERIVRDELLAKCHHRLNNFQHGFLPQKSCTTQMLYYIDSLSLSLNDNIRSDVIYFDFAKAFDTVSHDIILQKLKYRFHIDGTLLKFIMNYLQHRKQCVVVGGTKSNYRDVTSGVPDEFIDDMSECISDGTNIVLYADDTKIWRKIETWNDHLILQNDINALHEWSVRNK